MNSINGFNSSSIQGSFGNNNINGINLNKLGTGIDIAKTHYSNGVVHYQSTGGTTFGEIQTVVDMGLNVAEYPFRITAVVSLTEDSYFFCTPGTVNSLVPTADKNVSIFLTKLPRPQIPLNFDNLDNNGVSWILMRCGPNSTNSYTFPDNNTYGDGYPDISSYDTVPTDDDDYVFVKIAKVTLQVENGTLSYRVDQFVQSSLWGERRKYSEPNTATYYFWRA